MRETGNGLKLANYRKRNPERKEIYGKMIPF